MKTLRTLAASAALVLLSGGSALAAGETVTIGQMSRTEVVGTWVLKLPNGNKITSTDAFVDAHMYTLQNAATGNYTLTVEPPNGATTVTSVTTGSGKTTTTNLVIPFTVKTGDAVRLIAEYSFEGTVRIQSSPSGAAFSLVGPNNISLKGVTPAQFNDLPPYFYSVYYEVKPGCITPKPQKRQLETKGTLTFFGNYICGTALTTPVTPAATTPTPTAVLQPRDQRRITAQKKAVARVELTHFVSQREVLPGGNINLVLRVHNPSSEVIEDLTIAETFDGTLVSFVGTPPRNGKRRLNRLEWTLNDLQPDETWSVNLTAQADASLKSGTPINFQATVRSDDLVRGAGKTATVNAVTGLPTTGGAFDTVFAIFVAVAAAGLTHLRKRC